MKLYRRIEFSEQNVGLSKFHENTVALRNFKVDSGDVYGLLGQAGAGRTITISILSELIEATSGGPQVPCVPVIGTQVVALR